MNIELEHLISENLFLEDKFIIGAKLCIASYEEFMRQLCMDVNSQKRITAYPEDMPLYKVAANTEYSKK